MVYVIVDWNFLGKVFYRWVFVKWFKLWWVFWCIGWWDGFFLFVNFCCNLVFDLVEIEGLSFVCGENVWVVVWVIEKELLD